MKEAPKFSLMYDFKIFALERVTVYAEAPSRPIIKMSTFIIDDPEAYMEVFKEHFFEDIFYEQLYTKVFETE